LCLAWKRRELEKEIKNKKEQDFLVSCLEVKRTAKLNLRKSLKKKERETNMTSCVLPEL
jgi:hypothetical protein